MFNYEVASSSNKKQKVLNLTKNVVNKGTLGENKTLHSRNCYFKVTMPASKRVVKTNLKTKIKGCR